MSKRGNLRSKKILVVFTIFALILSLTGCGNTDQLFPATSDLTDKVPATSNLEESNKADSPVGTYTLNEMSMTGMHFFADGTAYVNPDEIIDINVFTEYFESLLEEYNEESHDIIDEIYFDSQEKFPDMDERVIYGATELFKRIGHPLVNMFKYDQVVVYDDGIAEISGISEDNEIYTAKAQWHLEEKTLIISSEEIGVKLEFIWDNGTLTSVINPYKEVFKDFPDITYVHQKVETIEDVSELTAINELSAISEPSIINESVAQLPTANIGEQILGTWVVDIEKTLTDDYFTEEYVNVLPKAVTFYSDGTAQGEFVSYYLRFFSLLKGKEGVVINSIGDGRSTIYWEALEPEGMIRAWYGGGSSHYFTINFEGNTMITTDTNATNTLTENYEELDFVTKIYWK